MSDKKTMVEWLQNPVDPKIEEERLKRVKDEEEKKRIEKKKKDDDDLMLIIACSFCG